MLTPEELMPYREESYVFLGSCRAVTDLIVVNR